MVIDILGLIFVGLVIGVLARLILPGRQKIGAALTVLVGLGGAVIGGAVASTLGRGQVFELNLFGFLVAVLAAVGLVAFAEAVGIGRGGARRELSD